MLNRSTIFNSLFFILLSLFIQQSNHAQSFTNVSEELGIEVLIGNNLFGSGISFYDFDHDGWDDLSFARSGGPSQFYKNVNGQFQQLDPLVFVNGAIKAIQWVDFDNDGDSDLFVTIRGDNLVLLRNEGDWNFTDVSSTCGLFQNDENTYGASWGDYDLDGDLDVYICTYDFQSSPGEYERWNHLYRNNGDGTFTDVTLESNTHDGISLTFQSIWVDYDRDGWPDLYLINDKINPNILFRNLGDGTFEDVSSATNTGLLMDAMTATWGDYNNDSLLDFYETNTVSNGTVHMQNTGGGVYNDVAVELGTYLLTYTWAAEWFDADNDMDLDMYVSEADPLNTNQPNYFFINDGVDENFTYSLATDSLLSPDSTDAYSAASGDLDNDGALDFVVQVKNPYTARIWHNNGNENHWMRIGLTGVVSNRDAIGTWIELFTAGQYQMRYTVCGENYIGQNSQYEHFGLGLNDQIDSLILSWPSGLIETYYDLPADQLHIFTEGNSLSYSVDYSPSLVCHGDSVLLQVDTDDPIEWNTGESTPAIYGAAGNDYWAIIDHSLGFEIATDTITIESYPQPQIETSSTPTSCYNSVDGTISWEVSNEISISEVEILELPQGNLDSLAPGIYELGFTDEFGCQSLIELTILSPDTLSIDAVLNHPSCFEADDGQITIEVNNSQGTWEAEWENVDSPEGLSAGSYQVAVVDSVGCMNNATFVLTDPPQLSINLEVGPFINSATVNAMPEGGTPPYIIVWSTGEEGAQIEIENEGDFWVMITDSSGCTISTEFIITAIDQINKPVITLYPNPANSTFQLYNFAQDVHIKVIDLRGNTVISKFTKSIIEPISIKHLTNGLYFVVLANEKGETQILKLIVHHE